MARLFLLSFAIFGFFSGIDANEGSAQSPAGGTITVRTESGRVLVAEIHPRTDARTLWLSYATADTTLLRPVAWHQVTRCERSEVQFEKPQVIKMARRPALGDTETAANCESDSREVGESTDAERARHALGFPPRPAK